jgi:hypothetical protein
MTPFIAALITQLPSLIASGKDVIAYFTKTKETLQQSKEWTQIDEEAWDLLLATRNSAEHRKTDAELAQ